VKASNISTNFYWFGNTLALDFVNTEVLHDGPVEELLRTPKDFLRWITEAGLVSKSRVMRQLGEKEMQDGLTLAREYRSKIRKDLRTTGFVNPISSALRVATNGLLAVPTCVAALQSGKRAQSTLMWEWSFKSGEDLLRPIAASLAELLAHGEMRRIRRCKNPDCILYFYDVSRSNTRVWCSLDICGNKLRAAAFRKRHSYN
jgi:predicted RNA-binding Zn ribbon-like protein